MLPPVPVRDVENDLIVAATTDGYMLAIPAADLPIMARGKGNKIINIPSAKLKSREEYIAAIVCIQSSEQLTICVGKKFKTMKSSEIIEYVGERGRRGRKLPRGYQKAEYLRI